MDNHTTRSIGWPEFGSVSFIIKNIGHGVGRKYITGGLENVGERSGVHVIKIHCKCV